MSLIQRWGILIEFLILVKICFIEIIKAFTDMLKLAEPISFIAGATPVVRAAWEALGIKTIEDVLLTLPRRYEDYSKVVSVFQARPDEAVTLKLRVIETKKMPGPSRRSIIKAKARDASGFIDLMFFHQPWVLHQLLADHEIFCSGKIRYHPRFGKSLINPLWEAVEGETRTAGKILPVYGLSGTLTQNRYRLLVQRVLEQLESAIDPVPTETLQRWKLPAWRTACQLAHQPQTMPQAEYGRRRLAFDELLAFRLALKQVARSLKQAGAPAMPFDQRFANAFVARLPFPLTGDQKRAVWAGITDMSKSAPMRRLLQGDVGSGKTLVAAFLAAHVQRSGLSAVLLAPTDILARQHAQTLRRLYAGLHLPLLLLTRTEKRYFLDQEEQALEKNMDLNAVIDKGNIIMVGTHALLQAQRTPNDLGLAMVDEQHRFGVEQREFLLSAARQDGRVPHFLSMTATPIPRSLLLTLFGDVEVSTLREKPVGRQPIETQVCVAEARDQAYEAIRAAVGRGERAFVVCSLIDPSDALGVRSATEEYERLLKGPLHGLRLGLLHGRLKPNEKERIMSAFAAGELDVLVATAVIEVGVDVPQATIMAIEGAERFGLAQLHQFRGRVGRAHLKSWCFLLTDGPEDVVERLQLVAQTQDGFALAEEDLKRRGGGEILGTQQSGYRMFRAARLSDTGLMEAAKQEAERLLDQDPDLKRHGYWQEKIQALTETGHVE